MQNKKIIFISLILALILLFFASIFSNFLVDEDTKTVISKDLFTDYMKENVNYRLQTVSCEPEKYYYNDSLICYNCDRFDACFGYGWIHGVEGTRANPSGPMFLNGSFDENTRLNYESFGVFNVMGCNCSEICECENNISIKEEGDKVIFSFPKDFENFENFLIQETYKHNISCDVKNNILKCGFFDGRIMSKELVV